MKIDVLDKEYFRQKTPQGFSYSGYWGGLVHYSKPVTFYKGRYKAIEPAKNGVLFEDTQEKDWTKRREGVFKSNAEIATFMKSTIYEVVSCTLEQVENGDLEFFAKHGLTYQPTK